jgi:hypothetical protein
VWQGRVSNGLRRSRSMNLDDIKEQIQENICMYVDETNLFNGFGIDDIKDGLCQIVVDTFKEVLA